MSDLRSQEEIISFSQDFSQDLSQGEPPRKRRRLEEIVAGEAVDDGVNNEEGDLDGQGPDGRRVGQGRDEEEGEDLAQQGNGQEELAQEGAENREEDSSQEGDCVNVNVNDGVNVNVNDGVNINVDDFAPEGDAGEDHDVNGEEDTAQGEHE